MFWAFNYVTQDVQSFLSFYIFVQQSVHHQIPSTLTPVRKEPLQKNIYIKCRIHSQCHWWPFLKKQNQKKKYLGGCCSSFHCFRLVSNHFVKRLKRCSLEKSCNKSTTVILHGTWTKQLKYHNLYSMISFPISRPEHPALIYGQLGINLNLTLVKKNLSFFLASSFLVIVDITITFIITTGH